MSVSLKVEKRELRPRARRAELRKEGKTLAVVYGYQVESTPITFDERELKKILREHGENALITMELDGKKVNTLMHKAQSEPLSSAITHVEFVAVRMDVETEVETDLVLVGDPAGVKEGGFLAQTLFKLAVSATPDKLPERVEVDVTELKIGDSLTVGDLPEYDGFKVVADPEEQICSVNEPVALEEPEEEGEGAAEGEEAEGAETSEEEKKETE